LAQGPVRHAGAMEPDAKKPRTEADEPIPEDADVDAAHAAKEKLGQPVVFDEVTVNVMPGVAGNLLMPLTGGGLHHMTAGARANVGVSAGRYAFELQVVEFVHLGEGSKKTGCRMLRVGLSTAEDPLILDTREDTVHFDVSGFLVNGKMKKPIQNLRIMRREVLCIAIDLDESSDTPDTITLYRDSVRICGPEKLPRSWKGKALFPTVAFRNLTLRYNFGPVRLSNPPSGFHMLHDVARADATMSPSDASQDSPHEVLFPVFIPDEGTFGWLDTFLKDNPQYTEISARSFLKWTERSGLTRPRSSFATQVSNDKPAMGFGIHALDDGLVMRSIQKVAALHGKDYVVMEVEANLIAEERAEALSYWPAETFRRVALVIIGAPAELEKEQAQCQKPKDSLPDISAEALTESFSKFSLPEKGEGFDEIRYEWSAKHQCEDYLKKWMLERQRSLRVDDLEPGDWFREQRQRWQKQVQEWAAKHKAYHSAKVKPDAETVGDLDVLDIFGVSDVANVGGGMPLFAAFGLEDWILMNFRFEIRLLTQAFCRDCGDPERAVVSFDHLEFYYERYYEKPLPVSSVKAGSTKSLLALVRDTVVINSKTQAVESQLPGDMASLAIFVMLTEEARRDRQQRIDLGDASARLTGTAQAAEEVAPGLSIPVATAVATTPSGTGAPVPPGLVTLGPVTPGPVTPGPVTPGLQMPGLQMPTPKAPGPVKVPAPKQMPAPKKVPVPKLVSPLQEKKDQKQEEEEKSGESEKKQEAGQQLPQPKPKPQPRWSTR